MDLSFDDLIPSNNAPADAGALSFDDLIPQESKQAIPVPPRRPESLGGTPESVPAGTITTTQPAWAKPGYYAEPAPALAPLKAEPKPNVAINLTNPNQDQDIQAQLAAAGIDTSQYETNTNQPAWAKPGFVPTAPKPGILEVAGRAARQGLYDALTDVGQSAAVATTGKADEKTEKNKQTDPLIANILNQTLGESWDDPNYWTALIVHGATASSPFLGGAAAGAALTAESGPGAFVGGALGGGAGLALQTLGPAYISAIKDGLSPDKAFDRAWEETGIGFVSGVIQGALPEFKLFGTTSKKLVTDGVEKVVNVAKAPIKEALFQILGAQPAAGVAQHEVTNVFEGKGNLTPEQIFQEYITNAASGAALVAAHSAAKSTVGALSERGPAADENSALSDTAINDGNPPSGGAAVAADEGAALGATPLVDPRAEMLEKVRAAIAANGAKPGEPNFVGPTEPVGPSKIAQPGEPDFVGPTEPIGPNPVQGPEKPVTEQGNLNVDTVPEAPATIEEQRKALAAGTKKVVLYPEGTGETPPQVEGKNIQRYKVPGVGVFDYIAGKDGTTAAKIRDAVKNGTLSDLLELGGVDKAEVAESVAKGNPEVAVTETTPEGVPVKEAAGTTETAPDQVAALEATKTAPENKIETKDSRRVLTDRITANSKAAGQVLADSTNTNSKAADALADLDKTLQEKTAPAPEVVQDRVQVAPKAAAAKKVSAARAEPVAATKDGFTLFPGTDNEITFRTDEYPTKDHNSIAMYGNKIVPNAEGELNRPSKFTSEKDFDRRSGIILPDQFENTLKSKALADIFKKYVDRKITKDELVQQLKDTITSEANAKLEAVKNTPEVAPKAAEVLETAAKRSPEKPVTPEVTTEPTARTPRILESQTPESRAAGEAMLKQQLVNEAGLRSETKEPTGKNWTEEQRTARAENNRAASETVNKFIPNEETENGFLGRGKESSNARNAIKARAVSMVAEAKKQGVSIPRRIKDAQNEEMHHNVDTVLLSEAQTLASKENPSAKDFTRFITREKSLRAGEREGVVSERRVEGDEAKRGQQKSVEDIAAAEPIEKASSGADFESEPVQTKAGKSSRMGVRTGETYGETRQVVNKEGKVEEVEGVKAASEGKSVMTPEMKALYESLYNSPRRAREGIEEAEGEPKPPQLRLHPDEILHHTTLSDAMDQMTIGDLRNASDLSKRIVGTVLRRLREKVGGTDVLVVSQEALDRMNPDTRPGSVDGYYDPRFDHIVISDRMMGKGKFDASLLAHEGMHALVQMGIHTDPALKADIQALLDHVKSQMPNSKYYGFKDVHEFVSEAMSNPRFQEMLMSIEVPKDMAASFGLDKRHNSVWHAMLSAVNDAFLKIRNLFGNDAKAYDALSAIIHLTERAETSADEIREPLRQMREFDVLLSQGRGEIEALENEFIKRGVPISDARNLAEMVHEHLGDNLDMQKAEPIITQLAAQYSKPTPNAGVTPQGNAPTGPQGNIGPKGQAAIAKANKARDSKTSDMLDTFREHAVDLNRPVEKLQEQIGGEFYEDKRLMESRISERERQMAVREAEEVKRLARDAEKAGMNMDDVSKALIARHAKERNADIEAKDPKVKDGSGISNDDAQAILDGISKDPAKQAVFDRAVKLNDQLREIELNKLVEDGLLSKEQAQKLRNQYKEYTSLRGFADEDIAEAMGQRMGGLIGRDGVSVIGNEYRTAGGRKTESDNALHNMFLQARRAIIRGERNRVLKSLADAVRRAHNVMGDDAPVRVANSVNDRAIRSFDRATADPHILGFKEEGVQKFLVFKDPALAEAVQRIRPDELPAFFKQVNSLTNGIKAIWTHYSPEFIVRHFLFRYPIEAITNIRALREQGVDANPMGYLKDAFGNIADVYRYLDGNETAIKDPEVMAYIKEMAETGGIVNFKNIAGELNVKKQIEQLAAQKPNNPIAAAKQFFGAWEQMLNSADTAQRLAAYIRARKAGIDPKRAAIIARDITVDFARKGRSAGWINIWVPFGNIAMQTTGRMAANFKTSPSYRRTVFGIMAGITGIGMMNYMYGGKDKNGKSALENIPEYERNQNLILMTPFHNKDGERIYFKMPLPYPLFAVNATATAASKLVASKMGLTKSTPGEITSMVLHGAAETFTPLGHQIGNLSTLATPELARFITDISANKGWNGNIIHTSFNKKDVPHSQQGFKTTDQSWKTIAGVLAKMGLDMYPEDIKYTVDHFVGTERRFFRDLPENIKNPSAGSVTGIVEGSIKPTKDK